MTELVTAELANKLMIALAVLLPLAGLAWGAFVKKLVPGFLVGLGLGLGNLVLWKVYNVITDHLGLDTVKNLFVNLGLFVGLGVVVGLVTGLTTKKESSEV